MGKPRRKVRHRSIEWFERGVPGKHMDEVEFCRVAAGHFHASRHFSEPTWSPGRFSLALDVGGKNLSNYMFFVLFYCSLVCCCGLGDILYTFQGLSPNSRTFQDDF